MFWVKYHNYKLNDLFSIHLPIEIIDVEELDFVFDNLKFSAGALTLIFTSLAQKSMVGKKKWASRFY